MERGWMKTNKFIYGDWNLFQVQKSWSKGKKEERGGVTKLWNKINTLSFYVSIYMKVRTGAVW